MTTVTVERRVAAPATLVFSIASDIESFPEANPDVVGIEFLTEQRVGVGTRFRETRTMKKDQTMVTELEVTHYDPDAMEIRMVSDMHGTVWDTLFCVAAEPSGDGAVVRAQMDCRAHALLPKLLNPLMKGMFRRGMEAHLEAFQRHCEAIEA